MYNQKAWDFYLFVHYHFMRPHVKFKLNKSLDKKMAFDFLGAKHGGIDFSIGITGVHPELKNIEKIKGDKRRKKIISDYFDLFYKKHHLYLKNRTTKFNKEWVKVENQFIGEVRKIFKNYPFPNGKYIGYVSIIDCNPRFLNNKTFQVFYFHPHGVRYVTAHEMLHFIFYDYATRRYHKLFKKLDTNQGIFWDLAEIFNAIILHMPNFIKIHGVKKRVIYPEHSKYIHKLESIWKKYRDIDKFIPAAYRIIVQKQSGNI